MHLERSFLLILGSLTSSFSLGAQQLGPDEAGSLRRQVLQAAERMASQTLAALGGTPDACELVAYLAASAGLHALHERLNLSVASCINEESATQGKLQRCVRDALDEFSAGLDELTEQHFARLELCELTGGGIYDPDLDEDDFVTGVDHPYFPYAEGATWVYHALTHEGLEEVVVTVTGETREVDDIECIVVRDTVTLDGVLVEDTLDYFAQHEDGTVWYLGELSQSFEEGVLASLSGSFLAGEEGALPGRVMLARPSVGTTYRQELLLTEAEDAASVLSLDERVSVPFGNFSGCLQTEDFTPLEPGHVEHKYYAPGVGLVLEVDVETGERLELVSFVPGS